MLSRLPHCCAPANCLHLGPDETHEAMRDLCRAREAAVSDLRRARQHLLSFPLRHGRVFEGRSHWSKAHRNWLAIQRFDHRAQQIAMEEYIRAIKQIEERRDRLTRQMLELLFKSQDGGACWCVRIARLEERGLHWFTLLP
jgi:uncharacterized protein Yka (UPF0111/DUF47 family)